MILDHHSVEISIGWHIAKYLEGTDVPYEVADLGLNEMTTAGLQNILNVLIGSGTALSAANAYIGVGTGTTAFSAGQTDLQGTNLRKGMSATFPSRSAQTLTFSSSFGSAEANFSWAEWGLFWGSAGANMISRRVPGSPFGTKTAGNTWVLTATLTLS